MVMSRHQHAEENHNMKVGHESFEKVTQFMDLGLTLTNQNNLPEEIRS